MPVKSKCLKVVKDIQCVLFSDSDNRGICSMIFTMELIKNITN